MAGTTRCPQCKGRGRIVKPITLQSLLTPDAVKRISDTQYRFCDNADCETVYFGKNGEMFGKSELRVRVGVKETNAPRPVCYCFNHTIEAINAEVQRTGKSAVLDDIKERMKAGCWCETKSPRGGCCLGTVGKYVKLAIAEYGVDPAADACCETQADCCSDESAEVAVKDKAQRSGLLAAAGSLVSAVAASACCWLPLLLLGLGLSVGGVAGFFEAARPFFLVAALAFLGAGFYFVYFRKPGQACAVPNPKHQRFNRAMLWVAAVFVIGFALFPYYGPSIVRAWSVTAADSATPREGFSGAQTDIVSRDFPIDGMTCRACTVTLELELAKLPGVVDVSVSYEQRSATLRSRGAALDRETVRVAVEMAGFRLAGEAKQAID